MAVSLQYVARETASNLWRNRLMTIVAILTVAVSLFLVGSALLLRQGVAQATEVWQHGVNVEVFMDPGISSNEKTAVSQQLNDLPYVKTCMFRSQQYDYNEARRLLSSDLASVLTVAGMSSSYRCQLDQAIEAENVARQLRGFPGVDQVQYPAQAVHTLQNVVRVAQWVCFAIALVLLISASVLILNTIRLAIFARRREVSVMKLVGATNWFIRIPFMFEGVVQGVSGALVATAGVFGLHVLLDWAASRSATNVFTQMKMPLIEVFGTAAVVVAVGVGIGLIGSAISIRRFLED